MLVKVFTLYPECQFRILMWRRFRDVRSTTMVVLITVNPSLDLIGHSRTKGSRLKRLKRNGDNEHG